MKLHLSALLWHKLNQSGRYCHYFDQKTIYALHQYVESNDLAGAKERIQGKEDGVLVMRRKWCNGDFISPNF